LIVFFARGVKRGGMAGTQRKYEARPDPIEELLVEQGFVRLADGRVIKKPTCKRLNFLSRTRSGDVVLLCKKADVLP